MANEDDPFSGYKFGTTPVQREERAPVSNEDPFSGYKFSQPFRQGTEEYGPPMPQPEASSEGYKKAVASGAMSGAAAIPGQFGDFGNFINTLPSTAGELGLSALEKSRQFFQGDKPPSEAYTNSVAEAKDVLGSMRKFGEGLREYNLPNMLYQNMPQGVSDYFKEATEKYAPQAVANWVKQGNMPKSLYAPTTQEIMDASNPYAEQAFGVGPNYEPQNEKERIAKESTSFATQALTGPGKLLPRVISGATSGAGSELARQYAEGTGYELPAQIAGAVAGGMTPTVLAKTGKTLFNPTALAKETLGDVGRNYNVESTRPIRTMAGMDIKEAAETIPQRMRDFTKSMTGVKQDLPPLQDLVENAAKAERRRVYDIARSVPEAQSLDNALFANLMERPDFSDAMKEASRIGKNAPHFGIVPPTKTTGGNLAYWDQVKRLLGEKAENAFTSVGDKSATKGNYLNAAKNELEAILDNAVEAYPKARDIASNTFTASNAAEAGMKFMRNVDVFDRALIKNAIEQYTPAQRKLFNVGVMQTIIDRVEKGGLEGLSKQFLKDKIFQDKLRSAMGHEEFSTLRGKVLSENMINKAWEMAQRAGVNNASVSTSPWRTGLLTGAAGYAMESQFLQQALGQLSANGAGVMAVGGLLAGVAGQVVKNVQDRRVAGRMIDLIQQNDPKAFREIDRLTRKHPDLYQAIIAPMTITDIEKSREDREGRATGGRVGGIAERLMNDAARAHKYHQKTTEEILDAPDEHVVKALAVASKHI